MRNSTWIAAIVGGYEAAFADRCMAFLPANKVEIEVEKCDSKEWEDNGSGTGSWQCTGTTMVGTGKYADPAVKELNDHLEAGQAAQGFGDIPEALRNPIVHVGSKVEIVVNSR